MSVDPALPYRWDQADPLRSFRDEFFIPPIRNDPKGTPSVYLTGNSLGLQARNARKYVESELEDWATLGVEAHLQGRNPWLPYHEQFRGPLARLVGAKDSEVVAMNSLTVNLHLLMVSFYRPRRERFRIVIEDGAFPSDQYAVASQAAFHGYDPRDAVVRLRPRPGESTLRTEDIVQYFRRDGQRVALVLLGGVNYLSGQWFDMQAITRTAQDMGAIVGWDLAHATGNVPLRLHDWGADFAAWCSYKYLNAGPGAVAGAFVHEKHARRTDMPRFAGWWGNDPRSRFEMKNDFIPVASADAWQLSNPPVLALAPLKASLELFDRAGIQALREKSLRLTAYMEYLLRELCADRVRILTPADPAQRGCQLSLHIPGAGRAIERALHAEGVVVDYREPDVIRAAPVPLYNSYQDVFDFVHVLERVLAKP